MSTVSTGVGLCVLGVCVLGAAALSSPRLGNTATAASGNASTPTHPQPAMPPQMILQTGVPVGLRGGIGSTFGASINQNGNKSSSDACEEIEPDIWFTTLHPIDLCFLDGSFPLAGTVGSCDINGDGRLESIPQASYQLSGSSDDSLLRASEVVFDGIKTFLRLRTVMTSAPVLSFTQSIPNLPANYSAFAQCLGFRDMDGDGDLDALLLVGCYNDSGFTYDAFTWAENTGYQKAPPANPFDLDRDGHVNTGDLSLLLMEFTD